MDKKKFKWINKNCINGKVFLLKMNEKCGIVICIYLNN